jgi:hypothetical protein
MHGVGRFRLRIFGPARSELGTRDATSEYAFDAVGPLVAIQQVEAILSEGVSIDYAELHDAGGEVIFTWSENVAHGS